MVAHTLSQNLSLLTLGGAGGPQAGPAGCAGVEARPASSASYATGGGSDDSASRRPKEGKGSRGPRPRLYKKGQCQAEGCAADLSGLPRYHQRNHICMPHKIADSFMRQGVEVRFCQRCGVAHPLADFDGLKKSCRRQLAVHNSRRRKSAAAGEATPLAATVRPSAAPAPAATAAAAAPASSSVAAAAVVAMPPAPAAAELPVLAPHQAELGLGLGLNLPPALPPLPQPQQQLAVLLPGAELAGQRADWAAAQGASLDPSPAASVGSAALSETELDPGSWLLADTGSGGGGGQGGALMLWGEAGQAAGVLPLPAAAPCAGAAYECVCCGCACRSCGACCSGRPLAGPQPAAGATPTPGCLAAGPAVSGAAPAAAAAGGAGRLGGAPFSAEHPTGCAPTDEDDTAGSGSRAQLGLREQRQEAGAAAAAAAAEGEQAAQAAAAAAAAAASTAAAAAAAPVALAALGQLQQRNAAVYQLFVQQQLLAAQTLLATAGAVLSTRLPLPLAPPLARPAACSVPPFAAL